MRRSYLALLPLSLLVCPLQATAGSITPTDDTYVERDMSGHNNGGSAILVAGDPSGAAQYEIYLRFGDLTGLPTYSELQTLVLWMRLQSGSGLPVAYRAVDLGAWDEGALTWDNAGEFWDGSPGYEGQESGDWYTFDIKGIVDDYGTDELRDSGIAIISSSSSLLTFYSKDSSQFRPYLEFSPDPDPPDPPTNVTAIALDSTSAQVTWIDQSSDETGFRIWRSLTDGNYESVGETAANVTSYIDHDLQPGTTYYYKVSAFNNAGNSQPAGPDTVTLPEPQPPDPPANVAADALDSTSAQVTWIDQSSDETGFRIWRSLTDGNYESVGETAANVTSYIDHDLQPGTTYYYKVSAFNNAGNSQPAGPDTVMTKPGHSATLIQWQGYTWEARSDTQGNPGGNHWRPENVSVDDNGALHLSLQRIGDTWYSSEVTMVDTLGLGEFTLEMDQAIPELDASVVIGFFVHIVSGDTTFEPDIEFSRYNDTLPSSQAGQYVIHRTSPDTSQRIWHGYSLDALDAISSHTIYWQPDFLSFAGYSGHIQDTPIPERVVHKWAHVGPYSPGPGTGTVHLNLWITPNPDALGSHPSFDVKFTGFVHAARSNPALFPGDFDWDGDRDFDDFFILADAYAGDQPSPPNGALPLCDLNGDGTVALDDFFIFSDYFGIPATPAVELPLAR